MFLIAIDENGNPVGNPITGQNLRLLHSDVSFPDILDEEITLPFGYSPYFFTDKPNADTFYVIEEAAPERIDGGWQQVWYSRPMTDDEKSSAITNQWSRIRLDKKYYLENSDWTQLPDAPLSDAKKMEWVQYRQAIRDVTNQPDPFNIDWPVPPS